MRCDRVRLSVAVFTCAVLLVSAVPAPAQRVTTTLTAGVNPQAVAVNPVTNQIYVANYDSNNVTVKACERGRYFLLGQSEIRTKANLARRTRFDDARRN